MEFEEWSDEIFEDGFDECADSIIDTLEYQLMEFDAKPAVVNKEVLKKISIVNRIAQLTVEGTSAKASCELGEPYKFMGSVSIEGKSISMNPMWFLVAISLADNFEVYPLVKNGVRMTFTFNNLATPIE